MDADLRFAVSRSNLRALPADAGRSAGALCGHVQNRAGTRWATVVAALGALATPATASGPQAPTVVTATLGVGLIGWAAWLACRRPAR